MLGSWGGGVVGFWGGEVVGLLVIVIGLVIGGNAHFVGGQLEILVNFNY